MSWGQFNYINTSHTDALPFFKSYVVFSQCCCQQPLPTSLEEILYVVTHIKQNSRKKLVLWSNLIGACLWCFWLERNNRIFQDKANIPGRLF